MLSHREIRLREVFDAALQQSCQQRSALLVQACDGDADLLAEVRDLLTYDQIARQEGYLDVPAAASLRGRGIVDWTGRRLGPYRVQELLGRGGMGTVYRAVRVEDFEQEVAIKFGRGGPGSQEWLSRFEIERQVLAGLNHPGIARLFDGGVADDGRPYFVMEYVAGLPLTQYGDAQALSTADRVRLLVAVCAAVHYVHQQGVIHRDLKPANVLVAEDGTPKIVDFGLAKRVAEEDHAEEDSSRRAVFGTPGYMAPEQATADDREVGPPADIYALGALFYELLTGRPPFRADSALETLRQALEDEPVPPSQLHPRLPRDLETICLKCLAKRPERRYASALDLQEDLQRFLDGKPIHARPVGPLERGWRWCRRKPVAAALLLALVAAFVGIAGSLVERRRATAEESRARLCLHRAEAAQGEADEHFALALRLLTNDIYTGDPRDWKGAVKLHPYLETNLKAVTGCIEDLLTRRGEEPELSALLAEVLTRRGALSLWQHRDEEALVLFERAVRRWKQLPAAVVRERGGRRVGLALAYAFLEQVYDRLGRSEEAERAFGSTFLLWQELIQEDPNPDHPWDWSIWHQLSWILIDSGDSDRDAERRFECLAQRVTRLESGPIGELFVSLLRVDSLCRQAGYLVEKKERENTLSRVREAAALLAEQVARPSLHKNVRGQVAHTALRLCLLFRRAGAAEEARPLANQAVSTLRELHEQDPSRRLYLEALGEAWLELGKIHWDLHQADETVTAYRHALSMHRELLQSAPAVAEFRQLVGMRWMQLGRKLCELGRQEEAEACFRERQALWPGDADKHAEALRELCKWASQVGGDKHDLSLPEQQERQRYLDLGARLERKSVESPGTITRTKP